MKTTYQLGIADWDMAGTGVTVDELAAATPENGCVACGLCAIGLIEGFEQVRHTCPESEGERIA